eukprot:1195595-Prorocentrum_minimum.AAC.4
MITCFRSWLRGGARHLLQQRDDHRRGARRRRGAQRQAVGGHAARLRAHVYFPPPLRPLHLEGVDPLHAQPGGVVVRQADRQLAPAVVAEALVGGGGG